MAEIAVERRNAFPWWAWLLIGMVGLLLAWVFFGRDRQGAAEVERQRAAGPIVSLTDLYSAGDPEVLVGREVRIDNANVLSVTGDRDFWIGEAQGRQVLVILNEAMTPKQPGIEGRYDVNPGQTISIVEGEVKRFPGWEEARSRWKVNPDLRSDFEAQRVYIEADKLSITDSRPSQQPVQTQPK